MENYVDTHFHVWDLHRFVYQWPTPDMKIHKNYSTSQVWAAMQGTPVRHSIFIQVLNNSVEETKWVMEEAKKHRFIKGIVAGLLLTCPKLEETIVSLKPRGLLKGVRHILDVEDDAWIVRDNVSRGLDILANHGLVYELLVRPHHLKYVPEVASKHPTLKFVINHIGKPLVREGQMEGWRDEMAAVAKHPNVYCKLSGLVSEREPGDWTAEQYQPYIDHVISCFTADRCMYGSDWPVLDLADVTYEQNFNLIQTLLSRVSDIDKQKVFRDNAVKVYNLDLS